MLPTDLEITLTYPERPRPDLDGPTERALPPVQRSPWPPNPSMPMLPRPYPPQRPEPPYPPAQWQAPVVPAPLSLGPPMAPTREWITSLLSAAVGLLVFSVPLLRVVFAAVAIVFGVLADGRSRRRLHKQSRLGLLGGLIGMLELISVAVH